MKYEGVVYRPPSEASSLIVQVTIGCAHNTCTFCNMYKSKDFRVRSMEEIMSDLQGAADHYGSYVRKVFLADGDALVMKTEDLLTILRAIKTLFPQAGRVASYGTAQDILRKSEEELRQLSEAGLGIIYVGAESGDDEILRYIHKGVTAEEVIAAGQKLKRCGIQTSVTLISGLGGRGKVEEHALSCARLV
ncbi:MAG: radical SAM protein, partial [Clostridium sp.]